MHKLQQKFYPTLQERKIPIRRLQSGTTYTYAARSLTRTQDAQTMPLVTAQPAYDIAELRTMMKNIMDQMGTSINTY